MAFNLRSSNTFGGGAQGFTRATIRPEYDKYLQEQRSLELQGQRQLLDQQKQKSRLLEQLVGGGGGGQIGQPGGPDSGVGGGSLSGGFQGLLDSVLGDLSSVGESQRGRINESYDTALNNQLALFADRGLLSSNLAGNALTGVNRERQSSLTELEDTLSQRRAGAKTQIGLAGLSQQQDMLMQLLSLLG